MDTIDWRAARDRCRNYTRRRNRESAASVGSHMIDPNTVILDGEQSDAIIAAQAAEIRRLRLTDAEREAIREACDEGRWYLKDYSHIDTLRGLLERTK